MASELKSEMAFEIGDVVYFKIATNDEGEYPRKWLVLGRLIDECHGGIQRHYMLGAGGKALKACEIELTKDRPPFTPDPEYAAKCEAVRAGEDIWGGRTISEATKKLIEAVTPITKPE